MSERLEEIKNSYLEGLHRLFGASWVSMPKENFDWLIQQAERVQELEQVIGDLDENVAAFETLWLEEKRKNQRYKQALEFYAHKKNYDIKHLSEDEHEIPVFKDYGEKARNALESDEN